MGCKVAMAFTNIIRHIRFFDFNFFLLEKVLMTILILSVFSDNQLLNKQSGGNLILIVDAVPLMTMIKDNDRLHFENDNRLNSNSNNNNNSGGDNNDIDKSDDDSAVSFIASVPTPIPGLIDTNGGGIYWGGLVENALPNGFGKFEQYEWINYLQNAEAIKLEIGCGRMQNRLVYFKDGRKACARYRQNTDQIQGELFSYYLAQALKLPNLAPSAIMIVDPNHKLFRNLDLQQAQWLTNKPIVLTEYVNNLEAASIPTIFRPLERHLTPEDVANLTVSLPTTEFNNNNDIIINNNNNNDYLKNLLELAQWSDLIIFDYLTANLDRIVNNLYNYQWNVDIMDAPAHNLAKRLNDDLLIFLDNESGLLHGYRLLKKYEIYHQVLLENLCMFRKQTVNILFDLKHNGNIGNILNTMFNENNNEIVKDILPTLPEKSIKILNERIDRVYAQIKKCEARFSPKVYAV